VSEQIIKDSDGDLWEEIAPDYWKCRTEDTAKLTFAELAKFYGPLKLFKFKEANPNG
jgi:hypothetical protein